jgi:hypothetical protein
MFGLEKLSLRSYHSSGSVRLPTTLDFCLGSFLLHFGLANIADTTNFQLMSGLSVACLLG